MSFQYFIYQHLGLGDHFICNGAIRTLIARKQAEKNQCQFFMFVKHHNHKTVSQMYGDLKNLNFILADDYRARGFLKESNIGMQSIILIGHTDWAHKDKSFEYNFYAQNGVPFENKWSAFNCPRNKEGEKRVYDHYAISEEEEYVFVHDDSRYPVNQDRLPNGVRIVRPIHGLTESIIDYALVIQKAKEFHCIESSFAFMVDLMNLNSNFMVHRYARGISDLEIPEYKNVKEILK